MKRAATKPSAQNATKSIRWRWVLVGGALVAISNYVIGLFLVSAGVDALSFVERQEWADVVREDYRRLGLFIARWVWPPLYLVFVVGAALWVGRRVVYGALLHGILIGATAAASWHLVGLLFGPPRAWEIVAYPLLGIAGGVLGGLRGWTVRVGEEALYDTSRAVSAARSPREIVAAIGENLAGSEVNGITLWEPATGDGVEYEFTLMGSWSPRAARQWPPGNLLNATQMPVLAELEDRTSLELRVEDLPASERNTWENEGVKSLLLIPLVPPGGAPRALLVLTSRKARGFSRGATRAYLTTSGPAALALENVRLLEQARKTSRKAGILGERQRLAREIHDTLAQGFTSIVMNLEAAEGALPKEISEEARAKWHLDQARFTARESLTEARRLVWALRPESLDNASLPEALAQLTARWADSSGVEASANVTGTPRPIPAEAEVTLVRVAQEALANVLKHAAASRAVVTVSYMDDLVALDVIDDGVGFDPEGERIDAPEGGFGLKAMRERIEQLGGSLTIESSPGEGTTLVAELPLAALKQSSTPVTEAP
ncbi:MAG: sensor histidine kinase [Rubrobacteraceae bacterium]